MKSSNVNLSMFVAFSDKATKLELPAITLIFTLGIVLGILTKGLLKLIFWSKKIPKGAYLILAFFPLISLFPIPPQEIKKLERIKQERIHEEDESGKQKRNSIED